MRTLTGHSDRPDPLAARIELRPYQIDNPVALAQSLEGGTTPYNTYWVRFSHGPVRIDDAVENSRLLFAAAKGAGVKRIVHISITNASSRRPCPISEARPSWSTRWRAAGCLSPSSARRWCSGTGRC